MFVFTLGKSALRRTGLAVVCLVCLAGAAAVTSRFAGGSVAAGAAGVQKITSTQDIAAFFTGRGLEIDVTTAAVDKVKIPRKWDDSFKAFNQTVAMSGLSLEKYKGKTVQKWTALCPGRSGGDTQAFCILLVYKEKPVGAYLLTNPGGEVSGIEAAQAAALSEAEAQASADFGSQAPAEQAAAPAEEVPAEQAAAPAEEAPAEQAAAPAEEAPAEQAAAPMEESLAAEAAAPAAADAAAEAAEANAWPSE